MKNDKNKKRKFKLFDLNRDGKGVDINENTKPTFGFFFKLYFRKFSNLLRLNLLMIFQVLPLIAAILIYFFAPQSPTVGSVLFAPLYGINQSGGDISVLPLLDVSSAQVGFPVLSPLLIVIIAVILGILALTWGWQNVGAAYVLRGLVRGDAVFIFSDFFYGIKKNFKQGFFFGLIDFVLCCLLVVDFFFFYGQLGQGFVFSIMFWASIAMAIIYLMMRFYIYLMLVTFNIKNFKLLKNAFIFSIIGIKRNILAVIGIVLLLAVHLLLIFLLIPYGIAIPLVVPFVYIVATLGFISAYAAYPVIDKYMIAPCVDTSTKEEEFIYFKEDESDNEEVKNSDEESENIE